MPRLHRGEGMIKAKYDPYAIRLLANMTPLTIQSGDKSQIQGIQGTCDSNNFKQCVI